MLLLSDGWKPMKYYDRKTGFVNTTNLVEIRIDGRVRNAHSKKELSINKSASYPRVKVSSNKVRTEFYLHIAIISTFGDTKNINGIPNLQVDHIDRNRLNYSLDNLRFVTPSENNLNRRKSTSYNYYIVYNYVDLKINKIYKGKEKDIFTIKKELNSFESMFIVSNNLYDKYKDNLNHLLNLIIKSKWISLNKTFSISEAGIVKGTDKKNYNISRFSLGSLTGQYYLISGIIPNRSRLVHVLMAETFLNNGEKLSPGLVVDHIDTNKLNNSIDNLRIVTYSENMKNELTLLRFCKPIKCEYNGKVVYFKSTLDCSRITGVPQSSIRKWISGKNRKRESINPKFSNFKYLTKDEIASNNIKYAESPDDFIE